MFKKIEKIEERKLNCKVTPEMIQDLLNFRNVDASVELEILKEYEKEQKRILREKKLKRILDDNEY
jgi:hypothetical protein